MVAVVCLVYTYVCLLLNGGWHNVATYYIFLSPNETGINWWFCAKRTPALGHVGANAEYFPHRCFVRPHFLYCPATDSHPPSMDP